MPTTTAQATVATALNKITAYTHDRKTSARLLLAIRDENRQRSLDWCVQATIDQILRDRR
jgi:hypothetical protein